VLSEIVRDVTWRRRMTKTVLRLPVSQLPTKQSRWPSADSRLCGGGQDGGEQSDE
jgi:hypothetical protein